MKIEFLETVFHDCGRQGSEFYEGDVKTKLPDDVCEYFIRSGWAKDVDGNVETGERSTTASVLTPDSVAHKLDTGEV